MNSETTIGSELPILNRARDSKLSSRRILVHSFRILLFLSILCLIRFANRQSEFVDSSLATNETALDFASQTFAGATSIGEFSAQTKGNLVTDAAGETLGYLTQTSPTSDGIIGYSGPTNCLIAIDMAQEIKAVAILNSADTVEHVAIVQQNKEFLASFNGFGFETTDGWRQVDGVSGATLTSYSVIASIANRMSGVAPSLKFDAQPNLENVKQLFPDAGSLTLANQKSIWNIADAKGNAIGTILTTTPVADHLSGYQGPTATLVGFDAERKCIGLVVDQTYENEPYASYLNEEYSFLNFYKGKTLPELAELQPEENGIEGVSGATMTTMKVAEGIPLAAAAALQTNQTPAIAPKFKSTRSLSSYWADLVTILLGVLGISFSFSKISRLKWFRFAFQIATIVILGFLSGHMLSQASLVGWTVHSIPWSVAPGLVFLTLSALLIPMVTKHQPYCQHICPFGAMQQLGRNRFGWKLKIPKQVSRILSLIPFALLGFVVFVAITSTKFNLASIEPFDGFAIQIAGWGTIGVLVVGLAFSFVSPMAYCRFGCPTGAMLNFLRFRADSHRFGVRDFAAFALFCLATILLIG